jgi:chemotaxis protein MotA
MDPLFLGGFAVAIISIVLAMLVDGNSPGALVGPSSLILVIFGSLGATLMAYRKVQLGVIPASLMAAIRNAPPSLDDVIDTLAPLADVARREGMLALEARVADVEDPFLRNGVQLLVDGMDTEQVQEMLEIELAALDERHRAAIGFWKALGGYAPTIGMLGTVIGLVSMLGNLSDPDQLGIGMAVALLTTLYGVTFSNLLFMPIANRLENLNKAELSARDMALDGLLTLQAGASSRVLVERLETYLPVASRKGHRARLDGGVEVLPTEAEAA